jgi:hypothetical protein
MINVGPEREESYFISLKTELLPETAVVDPVYHQQANKSSKLTAAIVTGPLRMMKPGLQKPSFKHIITTSWNGNKQRKYDVNRSRMNGRSYVCATDITVHPRIFIFSLFKDAFTISGQIASNERISE